VRPGRKVNLLRDALPAAGLSCQARRRRRGWPCSTISRGQSHLPIAKSLGGTIILPVIRRSRCEVEPATDLWLESTLQRRRRTAAATLAGIGSAGALTHRVFLVAHVVTAGSGYGFAAEGKATSSYACDGTRTADAAKQLLEFLND
jgi:hypothetical protein